VRQLFQFEKTDATHSNEANSLLPRSPMIDSLVSINTPLVMDVSMESDWITQLSRNAKSRKSQEGFGNLCCSALHKTLCRTPKENPKVGMSNTPILLSSSHLMTDRPSRIFLTYNKRLNWGTSPVEKKTPFMRELRVQVINKVQVVKNRDLPGLREVDPNTQRGHA